MGFTDNDGWIEISDNGKRMPPDVQKRIFEPFFITKPVGKGAGPGLSIAFAFAVVQKKHGGSITIDSTVRQGSRFRIVLPRHAPEPALT